MKHLIETTDLSGLTRVDYDRIILASATNEIVYRGGVTYELDPSSYIYNEADRKYYQKLVGYGKPIKTNATVDLNSQWASDTTDNEYKYFKSVSYEVEVEEVNGERFSYSYSQCKVTWSNLSSITFKYMSSGDMGELIVLKMDSEKFTGQSSDDDIYLASYDDIPGTYNEFTIECDEGEHHIWFGYMKGEGATDEDRGFIGVPKYVSPVIDVKQGSELPMEYKFGGVSAENGKTYNINFNDVTLPNGNIVTVYEDYTKTEKAINYEYVDLGLPSRLKWATFNIGATSETESGVYFQWGETSGISGSLVGKYSDENYSWGSYTHCNGSSTTLKKYNNKNSYGTVDNIMTLETVDDAATQIMGADWRMPTKAEFKELINNTDNEWVTNHNGTGIKGRKFTSRSDTSKYIFIPATGSGGNGYVNHVDDCSYVWSSSLYDSYPDKSLYLLSDSYDAFASSDTDRYRGHSVRGVRK